MFGIDDAISSVSNLASTVVSRVWPDATIVEKAKLDQITMEMTNEYNLIIGQLEINKIEANHPSFFVAGARPAAMWVGVLSLFYMGIGGNLFSWLVVCFGLPPLPIINDNTSTDILMGLLGLGGLRSFDKFKGVATKKVGV